MRLTPDRWVIRVLLGDSMADGKRFTLEEHPLAVEMGGNRPSRSARRRVSVNALYETPLRAS